MLHKIYKQRGESEYSAVVMDKYGKVHHVIFATLEEAKAFIIKFNGNYKSLIVSEY